MTTPSMNLPDAHHVGVVVADAAAAAAAYEALGYSASDPVDLDFPDAVVSGAPSPMSARYVFVALGAVTIELVQPLTGGFYEQFLNEHGEGTHHVAFYVDDLDSKLAEAEALKAGSLLLRASIPGQAEFAYLDGLLPGLVVELIHAETAS